MIFLFKIINKLFNGYKNRNVSFCDIIYDILGKPIGKLLVTIMFLWITFILCTNVRYYGERLLGSTYPEADMRVFLIVMLVLIGYILRSGIQILARMNEIILPVLILFYFTFVILMFPKVKINNLTPISPLDFLPVLKGSLASTAIWPYVLIVFIFADKINNKERFKKSIYYMNSFSLVATCSGLIAICGSLGSSVVAHTNLPFLLGVKYISLFEVVEKVESILVTSWIYADFILISIFTYSSLHLVKSLFNLSNTKNLISIYLVIIYNLSLIICNNLFELQMFSQAIAMPINILFFLIFPVLLFVVGKIRKKL
jgi:spore germination protein (amino acid permease)